MTRTPPPAEPRLDRSAVATFDSFEAADQAAKEERWAMTPQERLAATEFLRRMQYPDGDAPPRLQRVFAVVPRRGR